MVHCNEDHPAEQGFTGKISGLKMDANKGSKEKEKKKRKDERNRNAKMNRGLRHNTKLAKVVSEKTTLEETDKQLVSQISQNNDSQSTKIKKKSCVDGKTDIQSYASKESRKEAVEAPNRKNESKEKSKGSQTKILKSNQKTNQRGNKSNNEQGKNNTNLNNQSNSKRKGKKKEFDDNDTFESSKGILQNNRKSKKNNAKKINQQIDHSNDLMARKGSSKGSKSTLSKTNEDGTERSGDQPEHRPRVRKSRTKKIMYPNYMTLTECNRTYVSGDKNIVRGKLRVIPGGSVAFVSCDRGMYSRDIVIQSELERNRGLDGDIVYVQVLGPLDTETKQSHPENLDEDKKECQMTNDTTRDTLADFMDQMSLDDSQEEYDDDESSAESGIGNNEEKAQMEVKRWNDDEIQKKLWNPLVNTRKANDSPSSNNIADGEQYRGSVIYVVPPKSAGNTQPSEINPSDESYRHVAPKRTLVGTLTKLPGENSKFFLLVPNNRSLPRFMTPASTKDILSSKSGNKEPQLYKAEYVYGSWKQNEKWAPCINLKALGRSCNVQDETEALLAEYGVDHGDFTSDVFKVVEDAVKSGRVVNDAGELEWEPTPDMLKGRRDFRNERIFTIDPTTAKDLDDALHIKKLPDGRVEIGVHIADVSYFVSHGTAVDHEAIRRATTVYLVDRTIPMLPRPLCEIACSLNENVERLAFSCVWRMNMDGTVENGDKGGVNEVWYGRSVIRSCARLDYATAQNIIDKKVATGEKADDIDTTLWPKSRQPSGQHTIDQVASDVRLMHSVAMARRRLRVGNGALVLNGVKLTFQLQPDGETPKLCEPYPIRDSNRLVEEYMLLANFLVAQRLITHTGGLAMLRHHPVPDRNGIESVVDVAKASGHHIDAQSSQSLQKSLNRVARNCDDELVLQCITELLMTPMKPADYIAAGFKSEEEWRHFALNIPYYTHFTSPIRRYADIMVHRLLQASIDEGESMVNEFYVDEEEMQNIADQCNEMRMNAKRASERSDRVFLSIYLKANPIDSALGVVLSVGEKTFLTFVPSLGVCTAVFVDHHKDQFNIYSEVSSDSKKRKIQFVPKQTPQENMVTNNNNTWSKLDIRVFTKIEVSCHCKESPPIDVQLLVKGPWQGA